MKRSILLLSLALIAALGVVFGLSFHVSKEWRDDRKQHQERLEIQGRLPLSALINGTCGKDDLRLNQEAFSAHLQNLGGDLNLREPQAELVRQLILGRAQAGCDLRMRRAEIHQAAQGNPFNNPKTARPFMDSLLDFRQNLTEETLKETQVQRQLLDSLSDEQLQDIDGQILPRLIPGLSLREFTGSPSHRNRGSENRSAENRNGENRGGRNFHR